ncbi:MAG TPA: septum formation initiator family protein [Firmicutes bacterium]|nr:septum formation initiator family protein [Bacillota bacterium]
MNMRDAIRKVLTVVALIILCIAYVTGYVRLVRTRQDVRATLAEIELWQSENQKLAKEIEFLKSDEYIEKTAREKLGLVRPGETAVIVCEPVRPEAASPVKKRPKDPRLIFGD